MDHILLRCVFARQIWHNCFAQARIELAVVPTMEDSLQQWWMVARKRIPKPNRKDFDSFAMLICWHLWKNCNNRVFDPRIPLATVDRFASQIFDELRMWERAGGHGASVFYE